MSEENALTIQPAKQGMVAELEMFDRMYDKACKLAEVMAKGVCAIPKHLQGNPADCMAVIMQAWRWGLDPLAVCQKTFFVNGVLGYEAQLIHSVLLKLLPIEGRPDFEELPPQGGKGEGVKVSIKLKGESEPRELTIWKEQCKPRNSPLWTTRPYQQLCYVAIREWARRHAPEVIMGVYVDDEIPMPESPKVGAEHAVNITPPKSKAEEFSQGVSDKIEVCTPEGQASYYAKDLRAACNALLKAHAARKKSDSMEEWLDIVRLNQALLSRLEQEKPELYESMKDALEDAYKLEAKLYEQS